MRKVVEIIYPALHEKVIDTAHNGGIKVNLLASLLIAYALEHMPDVLHEAERLIGEWETKQPQRHPVLRIIRGIE